VGTTVAPWQLFFQQSNVIDKRITPRFIRYERADTLLGSFVVVLGAAVILVATVYAVSGTKLVGKFSSALGVADAFGAKSGFLGAVFALTLLDEHHQRGGGDVVHQLRLRRRVQHEALTAPQIRDARCSARATPRSCLSRPIVLLPRAARPAQRPCRRWQRAAAERACSCS
jgi:hypothetical protein